MLAEERSVVSGCRYLAVDLEQATGEMAATLSANPSNQDAWLPNTTVIGFCRKSAQSLPALTRKLLPLVDVVADGNTRNELLDSALNNLQPQNLSMASTALVQLLRSNHKMSVEDGLLLESLTYSALQHGAEFLAWLRQRRAPNRESRDTRRVRSSSNRDGDRFDIITPNRGDKHNAFFRRHA